MKPSEQDLVAVVVVWLEAMGADVYQEVECAGGVADIVANVGAETWIVEVKTSLSLALLTQAMERRRDAHRIFVAAPYTKHLRDVKRLCDEVGIGLLIVQVGDFDSTWNQPRVNVEVYGRRWNRRPAALRSRLKPEHKTSAKAGAPGGADRWTPWRDTCQQLARLVKSQPGIPLKEAIDTIKHHYRSAASARTSLAKWISDGKVDGVRLEGGRCWPLEAAA
jgi:hypothetical protein